MAISKNWSNLRSFLRKTYNKEVNEWFADVPEDAPDNGTSRKQAKRACLILPKEGQNLALLKMQNFRYNVQQVHLRPDVFGIDFFNYQEQVSFKPQVHLYFKQDSAAVPAGKRAVTAQLSFRLVNESSSTMTEAKSKQLALKIKNEFALGNGFVWKKGKYKITYKDLDIGLKSSVFSLNETEGIEVVRKLVNVCDGVYNENYLQVIEPKRDSETNPLETELVFGRRQKVRRWRPVANVRFQYAVLTIHKLSYRIILVDRSKTYINALEWT